MMQNSVTVRRIIRVLMPISFSASLFFISCMWGVQIVPVNQQMINKYLLVDNDLKKVAFHVSDKIILKTSVALFDQSKSRRTLVLDDERKDDVYSIFPNENGTFVERKTEKGKFIFNCKNPLKSKRKQIEIMVVSFEVMELGIFNFEFMKNNDDFYQLRMNKNGQIATGGVTFTCLDGCSSLLMFNVREYDSYRGLDHSSSNPHVFWKALLGFLALVAAFSLYSR
jgi:hypothetical protein